MTNSYPQKLSTGVCKNRNTALTSTYTDTLDTLVYAEAYKSREIYMSRKNDFYSFTIKDKDKKRCLVVALLALMLAGFGNSSAYGVEQSDLLKLYAHSRIINDEQYQCFYKLINKESMWRVDARNGSHYGVGQMRNKRYGKLDGFSQVDWSIRYITKRYGSMCNGWRFFVKHGYH